LPWASPRAQYTFWFIQSFSNENELFRSKNGLPLLKKFQIKYGIEEI
jgi:hypothetical protein